MIDMKLATLFLLGMFMAFLWYLEEAITQKELVQTYGLVGTTILSFVNSVLGGFVAVMVYYGLIQYFPDIHDFLKVGIASTTAFFTKSVIHAYKDVVNGAMTRITDLVRGDK